jgi:phenylalanyl-tRNA synthetase alpha chain
MQTSDVLKQLHPLETKVLLTFNGDETVTAQRLEEALGYKTGQANQAVSWLTGKGLLQESSRSERTVYELTELGEEYAAHGTPEERIFELLESTGPKALPDIASELGLEKKTVGSAFGGLSKEGALEMNEEKQVALIDRSRAESARRLRALIDRARENGGLEESELSSEERAVISKHAKKRGASGEPFRIVEREVVEYRFSPDAAKVRKALEEAGVTGEEIGAVTAEMLQSGTWKNAAFRSYNIHVPPARIVLGRRNPYGEYLDLVKDKLTSLGFQEFDGPLVETEFWNSDALFMPQFHSARDIHDVYHIAKPTHAKGIEEPYLSQVAAAHEDGWETGSRGWGYEFDRDFTRRLILRSQGTVLSAKQLPTAEVPGRYFGIVRCFRHDQVDATHLSDFYQTEGIVLGEEVNLRTLLGFLRMFAEELAGATDIKYVPGYFPFTEPSVEVHIKHPVLGWFELGGSGIFRPEVTEPLGVTTPVLAWGLGIDRMALMQLGLDDLRELFSHDIESVRLRRRGGAARESREQAVAQ